MMIFMQSRDLMNEWARRYVAVMIADITVGREIDASQKLGLVHKTRYIKLCMDITSQTVLSLNLDIATYEFI